MPTTSIPPSDTTVRELFAALEAVPDAQRDLAVNVLVALNGGDDHVPAVITTFEQFPATVAGPQPEPVLFTIYATEGVGAAAEVESLGGFQQFLDEKTSASARGDLADLLDDLDALRPVTPEEIRRFGNWLREVRQIESRPVSDYQSRLRRALTKGSNWPTWTPGVQANVKTAIRAFIEFRTRLSRR